MKVYRRKPAPAPAPEPEPEKAEKRQADPPPEVQHPIYRKVNLWGKK